MKKKMTIEDLARITAHGFSAMEKHFDERFDEMATKVELEQVKEEMATNLEKVKEELQKDIASINRLPARLERRLDVVEDDLRVVKTKVGIR